MLEKVSDGSNVVLSPHAWFVFQAIHTSYNSWDAYNSGAAVKGESDKQLRYDVSDKHSKNTNVLSGNCDATAQYISPWLDKSFPRRDSNPGRPGESRAS